MSTHVVRKAETGEVAVVTPVQVVTDAGSHETSLAEMNPVLDYIGEHAPQGSHLQRFVEEGGTEDASACADELAAHVIPHSPAEIRDGLLWLRDCFKEGQCCFMTDKEEAEDRVADTDLLGEVRALKAVATELLKSEQPVVHAAEPTAKVGFQINPDVAALWKAFRRGGADGCRHEMRKLGVAA